MIRIICILPFVYASSQSIKLQAPSITEEDQYSLSMPERYKCRACQAIHHRLSSKLKTIRKLSELNVLTAFEEECKATNLSGYGLSSVDGESTLTGPGIEADAINPGSGSIQMGGEMWNKRMHALCDQKIDDEWTEIVTLINRGTSGFCQPECLKAEKSRSIDHSKPSMTEKQMSNPKMSFTQFSNEFFDKQILQSNRTKDEWLELFNFRSSIKNDEL